jgi:hypothetical protein
MDVLQSSLYLRTTIGAEKPSSHKGLVEKDLMEKDPIKQKPNRIHCSSELNPTFCRAKGFYIHSWLSRAFGKVLAVHHICPLLFVDCDWQPCRWVDLSPQHIGQASPCFLTAIPGVVYISRHVKWGLCYSRAEKNTIEHSGTEHILKKVAGKRTVPTELHPMIIRPRQHPQRSLSQARVFWTLLRQPRGDHVAPELKRVFVVGVCGCGCGSGVWVVGVG